MSGQEGDFDEPSILSRTVRLTRRHPVLVGVLCFLIIALLRYSAIWQGGNVIVGGPPDNEQHAWELAWWAFALTHGLNPFTTNYLSLPHHPISLMWNNSTPLLAILVLPISLLAGGVAAFNLLMVATLWASTSVCFLCLRRFTAHPLAAWLAGLVFGFSPFVSQGADSGRLPWLSLFFLPVLFLLYLQVLVERRGVRWRLGLLIGIVLAGQFLVSEELAADVLLMAVLMTLILAASYRNQIAAAARFAALPLTVAAGTFLAVGSYPLYVQFFGPGRTHGAVIPLAKVVSDLAGFVLPTHYQLLNLGNAFPAFLSFQTSVGDSASYLGLPLIGLLAFMAIRQGRDPLTRWSLVLVVVAMVLSLGPHLTFLGHPTGVPLPWALLRHVPLLGLAAPRRLMVFAYLGVAVVLVRLSQVEWPAFPNWIKLSAVAACLLTLAPTSSWFGTVSAPLFFSGRGVTAVHPGSLVLVAPAGANQNLGTVPLAEDMIWQADAGFRFRMIWGDLIQPSRKGDAELVAQSPLSNELYSLQQGAEFRPTSTLMSRMLRDLRISGASYVLVGPSPRRQTLLRFFRKLIGRNPAKVDGVALWALHR